MTTIAPPEPLIAAPPHTPVSFVDAIADRVWEAIAAGDHRGEVVTVAASGLGRDPLDLLAVPATLTVLDGEPTVSLEG